MRCFRETKRVWCSVPVFTVLKTTCLSRYRTRSPLPCLSCRLSGLAMRSLPTIRRISVAVYFSKGEFCGMLPAAENHDSVLCAFRETKPVNFKRRVIEFNLSNLFIECICCKILIWLPVNYANWNPKWFSHILFWWFSFGSTSEIIEFTLLALYNFAFCSPAENREINSTRTLWVLYLLMLHRVEFCSALYSGCDAIKTPLKSLNRTTCFSAAKQPGDTINIGLHEQTAPCNLYKT